MSGDSAPLMTSSQIRAITEAGRIAWMFSEGLHLSPKPRSDTHQIPVKNCHSHRLSICKDTLGKHHNKAHVPSKQIASIDLSGQQWTLTEDKILSWLLSLNKVTPFCFFFTRQIPSEVNHVRLNLASDRPCHSHKMPFTHEELLLMGMGPWCTVVRTCTKHLAS